jgi:hypothetical protein
VFGIGPVAVIVTAMAYAALMWQRRRQSKDDAD